MIAKSFSRCLGVILVGILFLSITSVIWRARAEETVPLFTSPLSNAPGLQLTAVRVHFAPGGKSAPHRHPGSVFAYVLSGSIRSENSATGPARIYHAGEVFFEPDGSTHLVCDNASDSQPAELLAVFVAPEHARLVRAAPK